MFRAVYRRPGIPVSSFSGLEAYVVENLLRGPYLGPIIPVKHTRTSIQTMFNGLVFGVYPVAAGLIGRGAPRHLRGARPTALEDRERAEWRSGPIPQD